ncbi:MAG: hypothetical protein ABRQ26_05690 [Syntrophomonadaceae bacterium]
MWLDWLCEGYGIQEAAKKGDLRKIKKMVAEGASDDERDMCV